jgi:hypothetical protein
MLLMMFGIASLSMFLFIEKNEMPKVNLFIVNRLKQHLQYGIFLFDVIDRLM